MPTESPSRRKRECSGKGSACRRRAETAGGSAVGAAAVTADCPRAPVFAVAIQTAASDAAAKSAALKHLNLRLPQLSFLQQTAVPQESFARKSPLVGALFTRYSRQDEPMEPEGFCCRQSIARTKFRTSESTKIMGMEQGQENAARDAEEGGLLGAVSGAVVGALAGGPLGAVVGAVVGGAASAAAVDFVEKREQAEKQEEDASSGERPPVCGRQVQSGLHAYERE